MPGARSRSGLRGRTLSGSRVRASGTGGADARLRSRIAIEERRGSPVFSTLQILGLIVEMLGASLLGSAVLKLAAGRITREVFCVQVAQAARGLAISGAACCGRAQVDGASLWPTAVKHDGGRRRIRNSCASEPSHA